MSIRPLIARHLEQRGVAYTTHRHPAARSAAAVAKLEHASGIRFGKVVVAIADDHPVLFVMPSYDHLDEARARVALSARALRLATEEEMARCLPGVDVGATPPLRLWPGIDLWMDQGLSHEGPFVFQAGTHEDAVEVDFADWLRIAEPRAARVVRPTFCGA